MKKTGFPVIGLLFAAMISLSASTVVRDKQTVYDIVIRKDAPAVTRYAANELAAYFKKVSGAELKTVVSKRPGRKAVFIGAHPELPKTPEFDEKKYSGTERFRISELAPDGDIAIMGADCNLNPLARESGDFGLLFGVYEFIERFLGVRWYAPGELGECFEPRPVVTVSGLPLEIKPLVSDRSFWPFYWNEFTAADARVFCRRLRAFGLGGATTNHSMMDFAQYIKDRRPDLFALEADMKSRNSGKRAPGGKWLRYPHFCFSNPDTVKEYCNFIDAVYEKRPEGRLWKVMQPDAKFIHVVPNDNYNTQPCFCEACRKMTDLSSGQGSQSRLVWEFVRKVALWAKKKYPDKKVLTLAYQGHYLPPDFTLPDNVAVQICFTPYVIYYGAAKFLKAGDDIIKAWSGRANEIVVWHYLMPYDNIPYSMPHLMFDWFRKYPKIKAVFLELNDATRPPANFSRNPSLPKNCGRAVVDMAQSHINLFFAMKSMAGCGISADEELERYYRVFHGPAAKPMKRFYTASIKAWENVGRISENSTYQRFTGQELYERIYTPEVVGMMKTAMAEAKKATSPGSIFRRRVEWIENGWAGHFFKSADAYALESKRSKDLLLFESSPKPVLDGKLDDPFWRALPSHSFVRIDAPLEPRFPTEFKLGYAAGELWFGIKAVDPSSENQRALAAVHDGSVYMDDSIEIFVRPGDARSVKIRNVSVNLLGTILDYAAGDVKLDRSYESGARAKVVRGNGFYTMEIAVRLDKLGISGDVFGLNVCRNKMSGVAESHERSAWNCPYGSFWNFKALPTVRIGGKNDPWLVNFEKPVFTRQYVRTMPNNRPGKMVQDGCRGEIRNGIQRLMYRFTKENNPQDYGSFTIGFSGPVDLKGAKNIEIRFRNPDPGMNHMLVWEYMDADGRTRSDWVRFCHGESFGEWRTRSFDIVRDGHHGQRRAREKRPIVPAVKLINLQIYSTPKRDGIERCMEIDYLRIPAA